MLRILGAILFLATSAWFAYQLYDSSTILLPNGGVDVLWVSAGALICLAQPLLLGIGWWMFLDTEGRSPRQVLQAIAVVCIAQFGKYIPGNIAQHVGRIALSRTHGISLGQATFAMYLEIVSLVLVACLLAIVSLAGAGRQDVFAVPEVPGAWVFVTVLALAAAAPFVGIRAFNMANAWWARRRGAPALPARFPPQRRFWMAFGLYTLNYLALGLALELIAEQVFGASAGNFLLLTGIFAVSWIAGFIAPGAPAGLGVREVILTALLSPLYGPQTALGMAAVLRIVTVLGDALAFLMGLGISRLTGTDRGQQGCEATR